MDYLPQSSQGPALSEMSFQGLLYQRNSSQPHYILSTPILFMYPPGTSLAFNPSTSGLPLNSLFPLGRTDGHKLCSSRLTLGRFFPLQLCTGGYLQPWQLHTTPLYLATSQIPGLVSLADIQHGFSVTLLLQLQPEGASLHVHRTSTLTLTWVALEP